MNAVRFLDAAEKELWQERRYYNQRVAGLGDEFVAEVQAAVELIAERPEAFGIYGKSEVRVCPLQRFPFNLFYLPVGDDIYLVAVAHQRRRPGYWKSRLRKI